MAFKNKRKNSPTASRGRKKDPSRRGVELPPLFVKTGKRVNRWDDGYRAVRVREKGGYLYLQWRDGGKFRFHYLGIAK